MKSIPDRYLVNVKDKTEIDQLLEKSASARNAGKYTEPIRRRIGVNAQFEERGLLYALLDH